MSHNATRLNITERFASHGGGTRFTLHWDLHDGVLVAAGFHLDDARAWATVDFATGELHKVSIHPDAIRCGLAAPHLAGPKSMYDANGFMVWAAHGNLVESLKFHADYADVDLSWSRRPRNRKMSVKLFDNVVYAITSRLPVLLQEGFFDRRADDPVVQGWYVVSFGTAQFVVQGEDEAHAVAAAQALHVGDESFTVRAARRSEVPKT